MADLCRTRPGIFGGSSEVGIVVGLRKKMGHRVRVDTPALDRLPIPCLVAVRLNAFVDHTIVVREVRGGELVVMDPLYGVDTIRLANFARTWTGTAIWIE